MTAQALPDQYPALGQLFQQAPLLGFLQAGDQQKIADDNNARLQSSYDMQQRQTEAMNPLDLSYRQGQIQHQAAQAKLMDAQTQGLNLGNLYTGETQAGRIDATNAQSATTATKSKADQLEEQGRIYGQLSTRLQDPSLTPWERANIVKTALADKLGSHPGITEGLVSHAQDLPDWMDKLSQESYSHSRDARKADADFAKNTQKYAMMGENQLALEELRQSGRMEMSSMKESLKPKKAETFDQLKARWTDAANQGDVQAQMALKNLYTNEGAMRQMSGLTGDALKTGILSLPAYQPAQPKYGPPQVPGMSPAPTMPGTGPIRQGSVNPMTSQPGDRNIGAALLQQYQELATAIADPTLPADQKAAKQRDMVELQSQMSAMKIPAPSARTMVIPQGFTPLGDGTFRTPDGRIVRPKQ